MDEVLLDAAGRCRSPVTMQRWGDLRLELPVGPLFCVINGPT